ncbi:hypothetical protein F2Q69_00030005 [Brassica cretica]|uniref:Uncharacterized protein n=1 Tax=Brassica cretica TaxID=69181 RepID=A0A8S9RW00_BRACR|nr:hypothetical protein F2Q69_00030005 [Brassica cretica]
MEGSPYRNISISRRKGAVPWTGPGMFPSGDPEAGVLSGVWRNSIPEYFCPTVCLLFLDFVTELGE